MARFFVLSRYGESLSLALRLQREGHSVALYVDAPAARFVGRGLVERVGSITPARGAVVLVTDTGFAEQAATLRRQGHRVLGGNALERAEMDRAAGARLMADAGLRVPDTYTFHDVRAASAFLAREDGPWYFKPDNAPSWLTHNAPSSASMARWLAHIKGQLRGSSFVLQRAVAGTEVDVDVWCDGTRIVSPNCVDLEEKRLLAGDLGPRTGCQANLVFSTTDDLVESTVARFYSRLVAEKYVGVFSVNTIVTSDGDVYGLECTARLGYDSLQAWMALVPGDLGAQLDAFTAGRLDEWEMASAGTLALSLHLSIPPYPIDDPAAIARTRGTPLDEALADAPGVYLYDVMRTRDGLAAAGSDGSIATLVETGHALPVLRSRLVERAAEFDIPQAQYRIDPMESAEARLEALQALGLLARQPASDAVEETITHWMDKDAEERERELARLQARAGLLERTLARKDAPRVDGLTHVRPHVLPERIEGVFTQPSDGPPSAARLDTLTPILREAWASARDRARDLEAALERAVKLASEVSASGGVGSAGSSDSPTPGAGPVIDGSNTGFSEPGGMDALSGDNAGDTGPTSAGGPI